MDRIQTAPPPFKLVIAEVAPVELAAELAKRGDAWVKARSAQNERWVWVSLELTKPPWPNDGNVWRRFVEMFIEGTTSTHNNIPPSRNMPGLFRFSAMKWWASIPRDNAKRWLQSVFRSARQVEHPDGTKLVPVEFIDIDDLRQRQFWMNWEIA